MLVTETIQSVKNKILTLTQDRNRTKSQAGSAKN